jgi:hypothetical protein
MKTLALPLDFKSFDPLEPCDPRLFELADSFCRAELSEYPEFKSYRKIWVTVVIDNDGEMLRVSGFQALMTVVDLPISRYTDSKSAKLLSERVDSYCADNGLRGAPVFVYLSSKEKPEQRCRDWVKWLKFWNAVPADRFLVRVR